MEKEAEMILSDSRSDIYNYDLETYALLGEPIAHIYDVGTTSELLGVDLGAFAEGRVKLRRDAENKRSEAIFIINAETGEVLEEKLLGPVVRIIEGSFAQGGFVSRAVTTIPVNISGDRIYCKSDRSK